MTRHPMTLQEVVLRLPGMETVSVRRDVHFAGSGGTPLPLDLYRPSDSPAAPLPAVMLVTGYSDVGGRQMLGCSLKDMASYQGWARLIAALGMAAVAYETAEPVVDTRAALDHVTANAAALGIDPARIGVWSCSGNVPNALALLQEPRGIACAALCYGYMLDGDGRDDVAQAARQFGFAYPAAEASFDALRNTPLLVVRAGRDETPGLNASVDRFVAHALTENADITVLSYPDGPHAFDLLDDNDRSRLIVRQVLRFFEAHLLGRS